MTESKTPTNTNASQVKPLCEAHNPKIYAEIVQSNFLYHDQQFGYR